MFRRQRGRSVAGWARRHERLGLTLILGGFLAVCALLTYDNVSGSSPDDRGGVLVTNLVAWGVGLAVCTGYQFVLWRRGRLVLWSAKDRAEERAAIDRGKPGVGAAVGLALLIPAAVEGVVISLFGGLVLGLTPVLLWIAFVLRPDKHAGVDLKRRDIFGRPTE